MKTIFRTIIAASFALLMSMTLSAQPNGKKISREELAVKQAEHISTELAFDDATSRKFQETYCNFQKEIWALGPSLGKQQSDNPGEEEMKLRYLQHVPLAEADIPGVRDRARYDAQALSAEAAGTKATATIKTEKQCAEIDCIMDSSPSQ